MARTINTNTVTKIVSQLCAEANFSLRRDVLSALKSAYRKETNSKAKRMLKAIIDNAAIARKERLAICQDTGLPCVFVEIGQNVRIIGDLKRAINKGIEIGYKKASLRNSIIADPLFRGKSKYSPAVIHIDIVKGNKLKLTVLPKGFGCENKSQLKMFNPTVSLDEIKKFIIEAVKAAGPDACPPFVVGVGIGGTADYAMYLAKKALLKKLIRLPGYPVTRLSGTRKLELDSLKAINKLSIGPMGLGGKTTALAVNIETYPTHIAGLPVAVNISCHALRSATKTI
ncbi:MAG: fumarate hydratase [Candidatus Omnitrophota bacterium]|nr:fumarate hydratase [Candidatus Omnitrophota bacterium]